MVLGLVLELAENAILHAYKLALMLLVELFKALKSEGLGQCCKIHSDHRAGESLHKTNHECSKSSKNQS